MATLSLLIILCSTLPILTLSEFHQESPVVWVESTVAVSPQPTDINILRLASPCNKFFQLQNIPLASIRDAVKQCDMV